VSPRYRPLPQAGRARPEDALPLAGGALWFTHAERLSRAEPPRVLQAGQIPAPVLARLTAPRADVLGFDLSRPRLMGILNVTPDSFSDGGRFAAFEDAVAAGLAMQASGADLIDIGGESTRPGAAELPEAEEIRRTAPVIAALRAAGGALPLSIDTRKAGVARAALATVAGMVNDVSGFTFDTALAPLCAASGVPVCVMHAQGDPATMQDAPAYDDVVLDVCDFLETRIAALEAQGIVRERIVVDPGIGFGKTQAHNLALLRNIAVFHGLGCPVLLGASRKGFIGRIGKETQALRRAPGSIAVALAALAQGVQLLRVHDVAETAQALRLWRAVRDEGEDA
jgi:dihydropteroate synthase